MVIATYKLHFVKKNVPSFFSVSDLVEPLMRLIPCFHALLSKIGDHCFKCISKGSKDRKNNFFPGYATGNFVEKN